MRWGYWLFLFMLCGFGLVYLIWPENVPAAHYGMVAGNVSLILAALSFTQSMLTPGGRGWQHSVTQGLTAGLWVWVIAALLDALDHFLKTNLYGEKADFFWSIGYLPMFAGLYPVLKRSGTSRRRFLYATILILAGCYAAVFVWFLWPHMMDTSRDLFARAIDVTYISFNFVLLVFLITISRGEPVFRGPFSAAFHLLIVATIVMIGSDAMLRVTPPSSFLFQLLDIPYFLIYFLFFQAGREFAQWKGREPVS